jgi:hypothetical protein
MGSTLSPTDSRWTWDDRMHPNVCQLVDEAKSVHDWCGHIENSPTDAIVGKVLCTCAALAIAKEVLATQICDVETRRKAAEPLVLLDQWIDSPTEDRSERIADLLHHEKQACSDDLDPYGVVWWTLRVSMSSVGNFEAGWALGTVCSAAQKSGFDDETLRLIAKRALQSRLRTALGDNEAEPKAAPECGDNT